MFQDKTYEQQIEQVAKLLAKADAVLVGAGAGFSTAAGLTYDGRRFTDNFRKFIERYGSIYMRDMYSAGFYPFSTEEEKWGYWSKHSYLNRIEPNALPLYKMLHELISATPHFVLTTNVDYQFWKAGFDEERIFATQGDYGEIQCEKGCHQKVYDAIELFEQMNQSRKDCVIPSYMVPSCPVCGGNMVMHLRCDSYFVEDEHWKEAALRYEAFIDKYATGNVVLLELGVGFNTPGIIRFPFENMVQKYENWSLIRLNLMEAALPDDLSGQSVGICEDIAKSVKDIAGCNC